MGRHFGAKIEEKQDDSPKLSPHFFHKVISSREVMPSGANEQENGIAATAKVYFLVKFLREHLLPQIIYEHTAKVWIQRSAYRYHFF